MRLKPRTVLWLALAACIAGGAVAVAAAYALALALAPAAAVAYFTGIWVVLLLMLLRTLPPVDARWSQEGVARGALWGFTIGGAVVLVAIMAVRGDLAYMSAVAYLFLFWLVAVLYLTVATPPREYMSGLKAVSTGTVLAAQAAAVAFPFSPPMAVVAALALFIIGLVAGKLLTFPGASFVLGLGMFTLLATGFGHSLGAAYGNQGTWVAGAFSVALLLGLALPPLPSFQRALLSTLVTAAAGVAGALLGLALGAPVPFAMGFLAAGAYISMTHGEERAISLGLFSVLASMTMALGFSASLYTGGAGWWVGGLFCLSLAVYAFSRAPRVRLALLLVAPVAVLTGLAYLAGAAFGLAAWTVALAFPVFLLLDLWLYFGADSRVLAMNDARVVSEADCPRAFAISARLAAKAGLPPPRIALVGSDAMNLFTVGRSPSRAVIAVTQGLLDNLDDDELEALLAHELSHVRDRDPPAMTLAAALACPVGAGARSLVFDADRGSNPLTVVAVAAAAPLFALLVQLSNPVSRERKADAGAVRITRKGPALADALEKLEQGAGRNPLVGSPVTGPLFAVNPFRTGWLSSLFATHPSTDERVNLLRMAPAPGG
ncbi:MAG: hypothetical protein FJ149_11270 [Euryarchaeota archaeon]|nr:hypothetical protein [Euryarchaeota archaeon]